MPHVLKKYISNRGSALFMVLSTMTALLISTMAMYFSMVSSRNSQYTMFNHTQATQSADSIAMIVYRAIGNVGNQTATGGGVLLEKMKGLAVGESISTNADAFESMNPTSAGAQGKLDPEQLGAYSVIITRLEDSAAGNPRYDLNVMSSVDGNRDSVHYVFSYSETPPGDDPANAGDMKLFTATGYLPNDAYINGGYYITDVFYDTQFTYMDFLGGGTAGLNFIGYNLYTGGDLCIGGEVNTMLHTSRDSVLPSADANKIGPVTWAIRGNFINDFGHDFDFRSGSRIIVGGDLTVPAGLGNAYFSHNDNGYVNPSEIANKPIYIYVNGDVNFKSSKLLKNVYLFINGSATGTVEPSGNNNRIFMTHPEKSTLTINNANGLTVEPWDWDKGATGKPGLSLKEALELLDKETETIAYPKWDLSPSLTGAEHITINLNATNSARTVGGTELEAKQGVYYIVHDENAESAKLLKDKGGHEQGVIGDKFVIDGINIASETNMSRAIVIDTGDDPNNIVMLTVKGNYGGGKYFMWFPEGNIGRDNDALRSVIIKGRGTVLIDVPKGVTYQNSESQYVMHYGWFTIAGGTETVENNHVQFKLSVTNAKGLAAKVGKYIHKECTSGDGCTYVREDTTEECTKTDAYGNLIHAGTMRKKITCVSTFGSTAEERKYNGHGQVATYCPLCEPEKNSASYDSTANWCANHTNKVELKNYYNYSLSGEAKKKWQSAKTQRGETDPYGAVVYPTTNFFIVSCDEAADIRVCQSHQFNAPTPPTPPTHEELPSWAQWWSEEQRQQERDRLDAKYEEDLEKYEKDLENYNNAVANLTPTTTTTKYCPIFGFIYAPYMMFQAADGEGETLKLCGGMIVSDYNINAADAYVGCYPEMMPKQLADLGGGVITSNLSGAVKSWKLQLM